MKKQILFILIFLGSILITDGAWGQRKKRSKKKNESEVNDNVAMLKAMSGGNDEIRSMDSFVEGMKFYVLEEYEKALVRFEASLKLSPNNAAVYYQLSKTYMGLEQYEEAIKNARKALELDKANYYYHTSLANIYREQRKYAEAIPVLEEMLANDMGQRDDYIDLASYYLMTNKPDKAIGTYHAIESKYGFDEQIIRQKQRIFIRQNKISKAIEEGRKLVEAFPNVPEYVIEQSQLLLGSGNTDESIRMLEEVIDHNPEQMQAKFLLSDAYEKKGESEKAQQLLEEAISSPLLEFNAKADVLTGYLRRAAEPKEYAKGLKLAQTVVSIHPEEPMAHSLYGDMIMSGNTTDKKERARDAYLTSVLIDGNNFSAWRQISAIDWELQQSDSMAKHTEMALEFFPNQALLYLQNGVAHMLEENYEAAADALEHGKMISSANPMMVMQFNSYLGDVYQKLDEHTKSDEAFEAVLDQDPDDLHALNNYSYFLSLRGEKLDLAKEMGKKLVMLKPNDDTYLDTYGWILYTAKEYEAAKEYLEKAALNSTSGTVIEHYGDVLYQLGDKEEAMKQWRKAKELGNSDNPKLLEQKLAKGKLIE